jgi:hypothetical protein
MREQKSRAPEPIRWLIERLEHPSDAFTAWFDGYVVDAYTGDVRCPDDYERHGFSLPDGQPDGLWHVPESEEYPTGEVTLSFWLRGREVLALFESSDPVMSLDHYRWYRIPLEELITAAARNTGVGS